MLVSVPSCAACQGHTMSLSLLSLPVARDKRYTFRLGRDLAHDCLSNIESVLSKFTTRFLSIAPRTCCRMPWTTTRTGLRALRRRKYRYPCLAPSQRTSPPKDVSFRNTTSCHTSNLNSDSKAHPIQLFLLGHSSPPKHLQTVPHHHHHTSPSLTPERHAPSTMYSTRRTSPESKAT